MSKEKKLTAVNIGGGATIILWGLAFWEYGQHKPRFQAERWFSEDTKLGGADKIAHFYATYLTSHMLSHLYSSWGYDNDAAARLGGLSSFGLMGLMELGDAFSSYGFSYEDFIFNSLGSYMGYLLYKYPDISKKLDFRFEYFPSDGLRKNNEWDIATDYSGMKFLAAVKLDGFDFIKDKYLKYLELHAGYYTRGYKQWDEGDKSRKIYVGVGINISKILEGFSLNKTARIFNYYQMPYTYLPLEHDFSN